jgi:hypothetical protein
MPKFYSLTVFQFWQLPDYPILAISFVAVPYFVALCRTRPGLWARHVW